MNNLFRPKTDSSEFVIQELPDELLLYNLSKNKAYALNNTSGFVWQNCTGEKTIKEIANDLENHLQKNVPEELIWLTLKKLHAEDLIIIEDETIFNEINTNRREILKKAGLATLVALPIVSSLIAPQAAAAQSGIILEQCSVCLTKTHEFTTCATVCQDIIVGDCHDNSGCGQGIFLQLVTCGQCLGNLPPNGNASTVSWHGRAYKT